MTFSSWARQEVITPMMTRETQMEGNWCRLASDGGLLTSCFRRCDITFWDTEVSHCGRRGSKSPRKMVAFPRAKGWSIIQQVAISRIGRYVTHLMKRMSGWMTKFHEEREVLISDAEKRVRRLRRLIRDG